MKQIKGCLDLELSMDTPLLNKYLFLPGTVLGTGDTAVTKANKILCPHGAYTLKRRGGH